MADVTTVFAAKDESFARTVNKLQERLAGFSGGVEGFNQRVSSMANGFQGMIGPLVGIGAAVLGAKGAMDSFRNALDMGGRLDDLTKTTGATAGELAILQRAFQLAGSSADAVGPAMNRLNRFMAEAGSGAAAQKDTLNALGLTYQDLANKTPLEQMRMLAERIGAIGSPAQRTAAAMDIFGKSGGELVPLFREFNSEISKAEGQLGGLPAILDSNAQSLADMGDVMDALSSKFDEFTIGLIAGVRGAEDFSTALANIDSAGFGQGIGQSLRIAFEQPLLTSQIIGQTLLTGMKVAGNTLINASMFAAETFVKTMSAEDYAVGIGLRLKASLLEVVNVFNKYLASGIKTVLLEPFASIPGLIGDPFRAALATVEKIQATLDETSTSNAAILAEGAELIKGSMSDAVNSTEILSKDWLGVSESASSVAENIQTASNAVATTLAPAAEAFLTSLQQSTLELQQSQILSSSIALNLESAAMSSDRIAPAFSLGAESSGKVAMDLASTVPHAEQSSQFLAEGAAATNTLDINGRSYAASAEAAAANISAAKIDAQITADAFTGMSDRMSRAANEVNSSLDKMREAFHFGQQTQQEVYEKARAGGQSIIEASKTAADYMRNQEKASVDMRSAENKMRIAENKREEAYNRASRMEERKQDTAANNLRRRADESFAKTMEKLSPTLEKGAENAKKALEEGSNKAKENLDNSGDSAGASLRAGGTDAASALKEAINPTDDNDTVLREIYNFFRNTFFTDFKKRLPQHAMS
jgi:hypothetical protein